MTEKATPDTGDKTLAGAINDVSDDDVKTVVETESKDTLSTDGTASSEGTEEETTEETTEEETEGEEEEESGEETEDEDEDEDPLDALTPEQLTLIKANPQLNSLRKALMRGYQKKTTEASQAIQLVEAYTKNPVALITALAKANGYDISERKADATAPGAMSNAQRIDAAGAELESLFGDKIGKQVRASFEKWFDARAKGLLAPLEDSVGKVMTTTETARLASEEASFKQRHAKVLTPEIEAAVVKLGNSHQIVPGPDATPAQYLDTLLRVVLADKASKDAKMANRKASEALAKKIDKNLKDREPAGTSGRSGAVSRASKVRADMNVSDAFDVALAELEAEEKGS